MVKCQLIKRSVEILNSSKEHVVNLSRFSKMATKKKSKIIDDVAFSGTESLTANDLKRLCVPNFKDAPQLLLEDYENTPIVFLGMTLSDDNAEIENATIMTGGVLRGASVNASKIWKFEAHEVQLNFGPIDLSMFEVSLSTQSLIYIIL